MNDPNHRTNRRRRGSTSIFMLIGMVPMMGIVALALEFGNVAVHQRRLQNYVDSKAVAALKEQFRVPITAIDLSRFADGEEALPGSLFDVDAVSVPGIWNFGRSGDPFDANSAPANLSPGQVPAFRYEVDPFDVPLLWGPLFDVPSVTIRAEAVAFAPRREVVFVIDRSFSMQTGGRMAQAQQAATSAVTAMANQAIPGDMVAAVAFDNQGVLTEMNPPGLRPLSQAGQVNAFINSLTPRGGTDIPTGLAQGYSYFGNAPPADLEVERILILIGDGTGGGQQASANLVNAADNASGIHTHPIAFCGNTQCTPAVQNFYQALEGGDGLFQAPNNPVQLGQILGRIITNVPMKLVR